MDRPDACYIHRQDGTKEPIFGTPREEFDLGTGYWEKWQKAEAEAEKLRVVAEYARHELTTLHGLYAHDGNPEHVWRLDVSGALGSLDEVLARPDDEGDER